MFFIEMKRKCIEWDLSSIASDWQSAEAYENEFALMTHEQKNILFRREDHSLNSVVSSNSRITNIFKLPIKPLSCEQLLYAEFL